MWLAIADQLNPLFVVVAAWTIALVSTPIVRAFALRYRIVDAPDGALKLQRQPVAYLGGLALFIGIAFFVPLSWLFFLTAILLIGIADDIARCTPMVKFAAQFVVAIGMVIAFGPLWITSWWLVNVLCTMIWILSCMNAFNLVDVMDGLLLTITCFITGAVACLAWYMGLYELLGSVVAIGASALGVLFYNWPSAQQYLGDGGSMMVGTAISLMVIQLLQHGAYGPSTLLIAGLLTALPALEVIFLIIIRSWLHIPFYQGSRHHFCHLLQKRGLGTIQINLLAALMTVIFSLLAIAYLSAFLSLGFTLFFATAVFLVWAFVLLSSAVRKEIGLPF